MSDVIAWGGAVDTWRCGVAAAVAVYDDDWVDVTVTSVWQCMGAAFYVDYCEAYVSCDGVGGGSSDVYVSGQGWVTRDCYTQVFRKQRGYYDYAVSVAASFVMPDVRPGSSYASATVVIPAVPSEKPDAVSDIEYTYSASASTVSLKWTNNAAPLSRKPYAGIRIIPYTRGAAASAPESTVELDGGATSATLKVKANSRYSWDVVAYNSGGSTAKWTGGYVYTTVPAPTAVAAAFVGGAVELTWSTSAYDPKEHEVWASGDGGATWAKKGVAPGTSYTDAAPPAGTAVYRVRTYAQNGSTVSSYARSNAVDTYTTADYPTLELDAPAAAHDVPFTVSWEPGGPDAAASFEVQVLVGGKAVQSAKLGAAARSYEVGPAGLVDGAAATVRVTVTDSKGLSSAASAAVALDWWPPAAPVAVAEQRGLSVALTVAGGVPGVGEVAAASFSAWRGTYELHESGGAYVDPVPAINAASEYEVAAVAANGLTASATVGCTVRSESGAVTACGETVPLDMDMTFSETADRGGAAVYFAGRELPEWYGSGEVKSTVTARASVDEPTLAALRGLLRSADAVWLRDPLGHVAYGHAKLTWTAAGPGASDATVTLTETEAPDELG